MDCAAHSAVTRCLWLLPVLLLGCTPTRRTTMISSFRATVTSAITLDTVSSGSALQVRGESVYIVSDDAPVVFRCSLRGEVLESYAIAGLAQAVAGRIPKPLKPDYEAAATGAVLGDASLVAFGSGSLAEARDSVLILSFKRPRTQTRVSTAALYAHLRAVAGITKASFNIEGAVRSGTSLLLFNRGSNHVFRMDWNAAMLHLVSGHPVPAVVAAQIPLPRMGDFTPGFSGAAALGEGRVLFCASVEATADWVADGEVLGSYVGILDVSKPDAPTLERCAPLLNLSGEAVKDKLEGVDLLSRTESALELLGVVDNDDGTSKLVCIRLEL